MYKCRENTVYKISEVDVHIVEHSLDYAVQNRENIADNWQQEVQKQPSLFNGELYLAPQASLNDGVFRAGFMRDFYATLMYWRKDPAPVRPWHIFGIGVIVSSDNVLIAARMAGTTAAASRIYFPAGSIDDHDIFNGQVNYEYNMQREVKEETGLDLAHARAEEGFSLVTGNRSVALFKRHYFSETAAELMARIQHNLSCQDQPELDEVIAVSRPGMMGSATPSYVRAFADWHYKHK